MRRLSTWLNAAVVVGVVGAVVAVGIALQAPDPLTGDADADAACRATASMFMNDSGQPSKASYLTMSANERSAAIREVTEYSEQSSIASVREAGELMAVATNFGDGMSGVRAFMEASTDMAMACAGNGWNAVDAGLISE